MTNKKPIKLGKKASNALFTSFIDIEVPFYDVDSMQIVWHGNYVKYIEQARCQLLDDIDYNYFSMEASGYAWPIVDIRLKYVASARFTNKIRVYAYLMEWESRLRLDYEIFDLASAQILNKAHSVQVAIDTKTQEMQFESPQILIDKLQKYIDE